jgi:isoquinoline 1-oxidoreductase subunit beta
MNTTFSPTRRGFLVGGAAGTVAVVFGGLADGRGDVAASGTDRPVNAYVYFGSDGYITLINPAIEMGQGSSTALAQVVADALDADWSRIRVKPAPYDDTYGNPHFAGRLVTADSAATNAFWPALRSAGAQARAVLIWNAMQRWRCEAQLVRTESGWLLHQDGRKLAYAEVAPQAELPGSLGNLPSVAPAPSRLVGKPLARLDLPDKLLGRTVYGVDARAPKALVAILAMPNQVGGKMADVGDGAARAIPGVVDIKALPDGSAVAVIAKDTWSALQGRKALNTRWTVPAQLYDSEAALKRYAAVARSGSPVKHVVRSTGAANEAATNEGLRSIQALVLSRHVTHAALEPQNAQATPTWLNQGADIVASTQAPSLDMRRAAQIAKRPPLVFKVQSTAVGGAFGRRVDNDVSSSAAWLALELKTPVHVLHFAGDEIANGQVRTLAAQYLEASLDAQGRIVRWLHRTVGSATAARLFPERFAKEGFDQTMVDGSEHIYQIAEQRIESIHGPLPVACSFLRGVGAGFNVFAIETLIDEAASMASQDALTYRLAMLSDPRARRVLQELGGWRDTANRPGASGMAFMSFRGSHIAVQAQVEIGSDRQPQLRHLQVVVDAGLIVNPGLAQAQIEGAALMGWSIAANESLDFVDGKARQRSVAEYGLARLPSLPTIECRFIEADKGTPRGIGEIALPLVAPAVANAWFKLSGKRLRDLPFSRV